MTIPASAEAGQRLAAELPELLERLLGRLLEAGAAADTQPPLRVLRSARSAGAATLAAGHGGGSAARGQALALYTRCLLHYRQAVQARLLPGVRDDDAGLAAAYFTLANFAVLDGTAPDPQRLDGVKRQFRQLLGASSAWTGCTLAERQCFVEQLAAIGVLVNESRLAAATQGEAAQAHLRQAARAYLQQLLGLAPERLRLGAQGLALAAAEA
ncbi:hypothetical protein CLD22_22315 [Rubrivivax gelatinosus]|nr:hypothetical protein [Rubrivivax gelatinosus]